jgi:hypothetical protein
MSRVACEGAVRFYLWVFLCGTEKGGKQNKVEMKVELAKAKLPKKPINAT